MKKLSLATLTLTGAALLASACGSKAPSIDQAKQDFSSPSGKTSDKDGVLSVSGKQESSKTALSIANGSNGFALTADGKQSVWSQLGWRHILAPQMERWRAEHTAGKKLSALTDTSAAIAGCQAQFTDAKGSVDITGDSYSYEVSIDFGACGAGLTGKLTLVSTLEKDGDNLKMTVEQTFDNVCETDGAKTCVDGEFLAEADLAGALTGKSSFLTVWAIDSSWDEDGARRTASAKGGMRAATETTSASLEYLFYVKDSSGNEVSYTMTFTADANGARLAIKGADGSVECTVGSDGAGQCTGTGGTVSWTADEWSAEAATGFGDE